MKTDRALASRRAERARGPSARTATRARGSRRTSSRQQASSLADRVVDWVAAGIINGTLVPGTPLSELGLAAQVGTSRTPVREALRRLHHDGLVSVQAGRGSFVADVRQQEVTEIYECREALEGQTARLAAQRMSPKALVEFRSLVSALEAAVQRRDRDEAFTVIRQLGLLKHDVAGNAILKRLADSLGLRVVRLRYLVMSIEGRMEGTLRLHRALAKAFEEGDADAAERINREMMRRSRRAILMHYFGVRDDGQATSASIDIARLARGDGGEDAPGDVSRGAEAARDAARPAASRR